MEITSLSGVTFFTSKPKQTGRYIGKCVLKSCGHVLAKDFGTGSPWQEKNSSACPKCEHKNSFRWKGVMAKLSNHKCDSRCTHAKGPNCECSCGGANHGSNFSA